MGAIKLGDIVGRESYNHDIFFKVMEIYPGPDGKQQALLKGLHMRLYARAPLDDLVRVEPSTLVTYLVGQVKKNNERLHRVFTRRQQEKKIFMGRAVEKNSKEQVEGFDVPGRVLHLDGDEDYLELCLTTYKQLSIPSDGYNIREEEQPAVVYKLLQKHHPDLLVLTGHDGFIKERKDFTDINNYYSSKYFVEAVMSARTYEKSMDDLVIFAGACQSHYEAILNAGANFASSPRRIMIHAYDPVFVVEKIAYTSIYDPVSIKEIIAGTITGFDGVGGLETRGKYRLGIPKSPY